LRSTIRRGRCVLIVGFRGPAARPDIPGAPHMAQYLSAKLGQQFFVENKPGRRPANIATEYALGQPAGRLHHPWSRRPRNRDQHDLLHPSSRSTSCAMAEPVAGLASISYLMLIKPWAFRRRRSRSSSPTRRANPDKINFASGGHRLVQSACSRAVQGDDRHRSGARPLSRQCGPPTPT